MAVRHYIYSHSKAWLDLSCKCSGCLYKKNRWLQLWKKNGSLVISALTEAWKNQGYPSNVILHSDRGTQYTSSEYIAAAEKMSFRLSYSKKGCPFDHAPMESFHSVLKKEEVYLNHYSSFDEAKISIFDYIHGFL